MKKTIKTFRIATFIIMLAGLTMAAFAQKTISIQGIPKSHNGMIGMLALTPPGNNQKYTAYSLVKLESPSTKFPLLDFVTDKPWLGSGNFAVTLLIYDNVEAVKKSQYKFHYQTAAPTGVTQTAINMQWSQFLSMTEQQSAAQPSTQQSVQKSITLKGFPGNYRGKVAMLALAPSPNSQSYVAYSLGTIGGVTVTFPLSDWTTDNPWGGSGNFAFVILIGENAQAIANKQYLYTAQTTATTNVSQNETVIQWSQFIFMKAQEQQPAQKQQPAAKQPAAQPDNTYIINGSGTSFSATRGGTAVANATATTIDAVIAAIKANANGGNITIQFGNGTDVLNIGATSIDFSGTGWGNINITGKLTAVTNVAGEKSHAVRITGGITANINADLSNTSYYDSATPLLIGNSNADGQVPSKGFVTITGGTITSRSGSGIKFVGGSLTVNNGTITGGYVGIFYGANENPLTINDGTIIGKGTGAIYISNSKSQLTINGGTLKGEGKRAGAITVAHGNDRTINISAANGKTTLLTAECETGNQNDQATLIFNDKASKATVNIGAGVKIDNTNANGKLLFKPSPNVIITNNTGIELTTP